MFQFNREYIQQGLLSTILHKFIYGKKQHLQLGFNSQSDIKTHIANG